ncbi:hypothetical protein [Zhaonella formicivorans]|jgi:hypothetical protein|uniref:hypothetical protein n=1 Tax=Zhaonella formicivorans TaxID=2528593 RepID=UPI0010D1D786|nr:hypothetical protein [Zhaonella formicivorans]
MTEMPKKEELKGMPPGVCIPWEQKLKEFAPIAGNPEIIKNEWEKLDTFAYIYLWYWVHR